MGLSTLYFKFSISLFFLLACQIFVFGIKKILIITNLLNYKKIYALLNIGAERFVKNYRLKKEQEMKKVKDGHPERDIRGKGRITLVGVRALPERKRGAFYHHRIKVCQKPCGSKSLTVKKGSW